MNIRNLFIYLLISAGCAGAAFAAHAQPNSFNSVTPERVAELEMMHERAVDFLLKNDFQNAIRAYSDILLVEPDDETAYTGLGQIYMIQGKYKLANDSFQNALHINPDNEVALSGIKKIMDPDGVEGMTSDAEIGAEETAPVAPAVNIRPIKQISAPPAPQAGMEKRQSAVKVKKGTVISTRTAEPAIVVMPTPAKLKRTSPRLGRLGLLHAQRIQMALRKSGFYNGPVNGLIGKSTKSAVREFQKNFGIETSGRITAVTWTKLSEYLLV